MSWPFQSGWLPPGWRPTKFRSFLTRRKRTKRPDLQLLSVNLPEGVVPRQEGDGRAAPSLDLDGYQEVRPNDLVMNQLGKPHGALGVSAHHGIISPAYFVAEISDEADPRFVHHLLRTRLYVSEYERRGKYMPPSQFDISWEQFRDISVILPPLAEQRVIADYLDTEIARIDALISKKRRLIELLEERKSLLAEEAISILRESEPFMPLKYLVCESDLRYGTGPIPTMLSVSIHQGVTPRSTIFDKQSRADNLSRYKRCNPGDIVVNRMRAFQGGVGVVGQAGVVSPDYTVLRIGSRVSPKYLHYVMRSSWFVSEMTRRLRGIGATDQGQVRTPRINFTDLGLIRVPVPPRENQDDLSSDLANQEARLTQTVDLQTKQIALLAERRQAHITTVVTGEMPMPRMAT